MEGILEYINALEDAQKQSKRSDNLITADTLLLTMSNTILLSELPPQYGEIWEDLNKYEKDWAAWKNLYKAADRKSKIKKQTVEDQDQFGAVHGALRQAPQNNPQANSPSRLAADLDKYFDALAAEATT